MNWVESIEITSRFVSTLTSLNLSPSFIRTKLLKKVGAPSIINSVPSLAFKRLKLWLSAD